jgi:hypothetical protein
MKSHAITFFSAQVGTGAPHKEADDGRNSTKKKPELPTQLLNTRNRHINSSKFVFKAHTSLMFYMPKKGKNVVLMNTLHRDGRSCGQEHQKPGIIMITIPQKEGWTI